VRSGPISQIERWIERAHQTFDLPFQLIPGVEGTGFELGALA